MSATNFAALLRDGISAANQGNTFEALLRLEEAARIRTTPTLKSYLGYCIAREKRQLKQAATLCREAIKQEPNQSAHYLNLGRIYLIAGQRGQAIKAFHMGLRQERNSRIMMELRALGVRKNPVFPSLHRDHPLNKYLGKIFKRIGMR